MSTVYFNLAGGNFFQDWSDTGLITADDNWANVPSIVGYRGDDITGAIGADLKTLTGDGLVTPDVIANQTAATSTSGGVAEFHLANPTVGLQGSGTADAPHLVLHLDATGRQNLHLNVLIRDIDGTVDNTNQQFNIQYRLGGTGTWTNLDGSYIADATTGPSLATAETQLSIDLPAALNGQAEIQLRFMTTNAAASDEWIGVDNIEVTSQAQTAISVSVSDATVTEGASGQQVLLYTVTRAGTSDAFTVDFATAGGTATAGSDFASNAGTLTFAAGEMSKTVEVLVNGDATVEPDETVLLNLSNASAGVTIADGQGVGTIVNDDFDATTVSISDVTVTEGNSGTVNATFTVSRAGGPAAFTVNYATANGTAVSGSDFVGAAGTISFAADETSKTVTVQVAGDTAVEADETFLVNLSGATNGVTVADGQGVGTIVNDDAAAAIAPWINEFHYDDASTDAGEFVEIAGLAGTNLSGYTVLLYNGNGGAVYHTINLTGVIGNEAGSGFGVLSFSVASSPGIQNGAPDGIALIAPTGVLEFISYEGTMVATGGAANGLTSVDVGVFEDGSSEGTSIARTGEGLTGSEFSWVLVADDTPGTLNAGQSFPALTPRVRVGDVSVSEGDAGTKLLNFTVSRVGTGEAFSVNFATANGTATAGSDYVATSGTLSFGAGEASKVVSVTINGDTVAEANETLFLNLSSPTGPAVISDGQGLGTITNDDIQTLKIHEIQGAAHTSPFNGQLVITQGIVTALDTNGFWIQTPTGQEDASLATSEGIFVFTGAAPPASAAIGNLVQVQGNVGEFKGSAPNNLTITELESPVVSLISTGNALPTATVLGTGGRLAPTEVIDNDNFGVFDPSQDGVDFYESVEGMLVTIPDAQAVGASSGNSTWVVANQGANATGMNGRGGITLTSNDSNPERVQIFFDSGVMPGGTPINAVMGDDLGNITGIMHYFGGNYEVLPTAVASQGSGGAVLPRETTALTGDANHLTVGAFNVENLDPLDPQSKVDALADNIRVNLGSPDIIGLEEVQDADGPGAGTNYSGAASAQRLIDAIVADGGPRYVYVEVAPTANNQNGGESNGNIRNGYLYNPDRVGFVSVSQITDTTPANGDTYANSRRPLVGEFTFNGETIVLVGVHNTSRIGSDGPYGLNQPPLNAGDDRRVEQTSFVKTFVEGLVAADPDAKVVVMGDFNAFQFETSVTQLTSGGALSNLGGLLPVNEQYSYVFEGNSQQIDHMLASPELFAGAQFDVVHLNSGQAVVNQTTDHDGSVARFFVNADVKAVADTASVAENQSVTIDVLANDTDANAGDTKTLISVSSTALGGSVSIVGGKAVYVADADSFDLLKQPQTVLDTFTYQVQDSHGAVSTGTVSVTVRGVADAPTRNGVGGADNMIGTALDDVLNGLGGADKLSGLAGADTLNGGASNDTLTGGAGIDRFIFTGAFGKDAVTDLEERDIIQLDAVQFTDYAGVMAKSAQVGANVVITFNASSTITLQNTMLASLDSGDFLFV